MHFMYKLIALTVVFGFVIANPVAKITPPEFDELAYDSGYHFIQDGSVAAQILTDAVPAVGLVLPKISLVGCIAAALKIIPKIVGLKVAALKIAVKIIKWLAPKTILLAIGAIAVFGFCKFTNKCGLVYAPVAEIVTPEVRSLVTPERLDIAQQFLTTALQQYAKEELGM